MSITASVYALSAVLGPLTGGLLTDSKLTWKFCFWLNLRKHSCLNFNTELISIAFGATAIIIIIWTLKPPAMNTNLTFRQKLERLDFLGALLLISAIICLVLALQWGGTVYSWSYSKVWGTLLGFGTILTMFILSQAYFKDK